MTKLQQSVVIPHLMYKGQTEEALELYKKVFDVEVVRIARYGPKMTNDKAYENKIIHAQVKFDGNSVMLADCFPGSSPQHHSLLGLFMDYSDLKKAENTYNLLSEGGKIQTKWQKNSAGGYEAKFEDKYGISWSLSCQESRENPSPVK